jgi:pyruvate/2-oxoglutarate dehydrogenase complex dihydrolipoamide dehydrogenase (E3) component
VSRYDFDLVIIGAGSGGMTAAEVAAHAGVRCALVERGRIGGDCLWTGCVPSKALIASANVAHRIRTAGRYGLAVADGSVDPAGVWTRLRGVQQQIAETDDSAARFEALGVRVHRGDARLLDGHTVAVNGQRLSTRFVLIATGSRPSVPPIAGLDQAGYVTSETLFEQDRMPSSLLIIGGGPIAIEMAQAHRRLGAEVTVIELADRILAREERSLVERLQRTLASEGVRFDVSAAVERAAVDGAAKVLRGTVAGIEREWRAEQVLVAVGRSLNAGGLGLEDAGVAAGRGGIAVDDRLRTSLPSVYACGDVAGRYLFTHSAAAEAAVAVRNMLYPGSKRAPAQISWATFTDPELAHAGLTAGEARDRLGAKRVHVVPWPLSHNDRARADAEEEGEIVVVTDARSRIVGAHILAPHAGELIGEFVLAMDRGLRLTPDLANLVHVYPTIAACISQLAAAATYVQMERPFLRTVRRFYGWLH